MLNAHAAAACSPTRAMLMSGTDAHLGGLGVLIEYKHSEKQNKRWSGKAGYEGYLNSQVATLPEMLQDNEYFTLMAGKVSRVECCMLCRKSLTMEFLIVAFGPACFSGAVEPRLRKGLCHASRMLQPLRLGAGGGAFSRRWPPNTCRRGEEGRRVSIKHHSRRWIRCGVLWSSNQLMQSLCRPPNKTEDPDGFYSTDSYTERLLQYFKGRSDDEKAKPFFAFLPFTAPHWPLQCSKEQRDKLDFHHGLSRL